MDKEQREDLDRQLNRSIVRTESQVPVRKVPPWWRGDEHATTSNIAAARQFGFQVMEQV